MRFLIALCLSLLAVTANAAPACKLRMNDLTLELKAGAGNPTVMSTQRYGAGNEIVRRYTLTYTDGSMIMLEQQDCIDSNLRLTLMSLTEKPTTLELNRLAAVLSASTMWRDFFGPGNAAALLQAELSHTDFTTRFDTTPQFFYGVDDRIYAHSVRSHISLGYARGNTATQFRSILTFTFGVRGA